MAKIRRKIVISYEADGPRSKRDGLEELAAAIASAVRLFQSQHSVDPRPNVTPDGDPVPAEALETMCREDSGKALEQYNAERRRDVDELQSISKQWEFDQKARRARQMDESRMSFEGLVIDFLAATVSIVGKVIDRVSR
jgi:hypothetical protein